MDVAKRLRELRKQRKYSTTKLAELANVGQSTISDIENNQKQPTVFTLEKICLALNVSLVEFFSADICEDKIRPDVQELLSVALKLSPNKVNSLIAVAQALLDSNTTHS